MEQRSTVPFSRSDRLMPDLADLSADSSSQFAGQIAALQGQVAILGLELRPLRNGQTIYLGDHEALTRLHTGHRIYVDTRDVGICSHLMLEGRWEPWIELALGKLVKPGMRFADVGANFGYYTLLGAQWVGPEGKVFAFEANPGICRKLRKSVSVNGFDDRVRVFDVAVFSRETELEFGFVHEYSGGGAIGAGGHAQWEPQRVRVRAAPLDLLLADLPSVDILKIDVEGAEPDAIEGAAALLDRSHKVTLVVEFIESAIAQSPGALAPGALAYLHGFVRRGFSLALIEAEGMTGVLTPEACLAQLDGRLGYLCLQRG